MSQIPRRRVLLAAAALLAAPLASLGQQPSKVRRIGVLLGGTVASNRHHRDAFVQGLNELGYVEGKNVIVETRYAEGKIDRFPALVKELLEQKVEVLFASSGVAAQAAQKFRPPDIAG